MINDYIKKQQLPKLSHRCYIVFFTACMSIPALDTGRANTEKAKLLVFFKQTQWLVETGETAKFHQRTVQYSDCSTLNVLQWHLLHGGWRTAADVPHPWRTEVRRNSCLKVTEIFKSCLLVELLKGSFVIKTFLHDNVRIILGFRTKQLWNLKKTSDLWGFVCFFSGTFKGWSLVQ